MWIGSWGELQSGEVGGCKTATVYRREGKDDSGSVETFWDDINNTKADVRMDRLISYKKTGKLN